jgi:uncharacterized membrane protein
MFEFPSFVEFNEVHSFLVHFPIALFLVVPLIIILGLLKKENYIHYFYTALLILVFASVAIFLASASGEASAEKFTLSKKAAEAVQKHKDFAGICKGIFLGITLLYALYLLIPALLRKQLSKKIHTAINILVLMLYLPSIIMILQLATTGTKLISEFKIFDMLK